MPAIVDWRRDALVYVNMIYRDNKDPNQDYKELVKKFFNEQCEIPDILHDISNLEDPHQDLLDGQVIKFRAMIQDMNGIEYYLDTCRVQTENELIEERPTMFRDVPCLAPNETLVEEDLNDHDCQLSSREKMYAVSIPGTTEWAQSIVVGGTPDSSNEHATLPKKFTIPYDSPGEGRGAFAEKPAYSGDVRKDSHFPLPESHTGSILKLYQNTDLQIDKAYELIAVLSNDPTIDEIENPPSTPPDSSSESSLSPNVDDSNDARVEPQNNPSRNHVQRQEDMNSETDEATTQSTLSIPRLHLLKYTKLKHLNPLLANTEEVVLDKQEARDLRESVVDILTSMLYGDALAAEYLLIHLISSVKHMHNEAVGHFPLNISGITDKIKEEGFVEKLDVLLKHLLPVVVRQNLTLATLGDKMNPHKEEHDDRVTSGILQLADSSLLILNETSLTEGLVPHSNVALNVEIVRKLCQKQTYNIEFPYSSTEVQKDIKVLLLSEGGSFFRDCSTRIQLKPMETNFKAGPTKVRSLLQADPSKIWKIRRYITQASLFKSGLDSSMEEFIQNEFVQNRQQGRGMTPEDLHQLLTLSRLVAQSCGEPTVTKDIWTAATALEQERNLRLRNL